MDDSYSLHLNSYSDWNKDPSISSIERVKLNELDFPAVTVCPDFATDKLATRSIYNMQVANFKIQIKQIDDLHDKKQASKFHSFLSMMM